MTDWPWEIVGWWLMLLLLSSLLSALAYPVMNAVIASLRPATRSLARLVFVVSSPLIASLSIGLVLRPSGLDFLVPAHCHGGHCDAHSPVYSDTSFAMAALAVVSSMLVAWAVGVVFWGSRRAYRRFRVLSALTRGSAARYRTVDSAGVLACCVGLWKPQVLLSRGLVERLPVEELEVVLAHEQAHVKRMDNLRALLLRWLTVFWPTSLALRISKDGRADAEQACDQVAANVGSPQRVALVIRKLGDVCAGITDVQCPRASGFHSDDASVRIALLTQPAGVGDGILSGLKAPLILSLNGCVQVYVLTAMAHTSIELLGAMSAGVV